MSILSTVAHYLVKLSPKRVRLQLQKRKSYRKLRDEENGIRPRNEKELTVLEQFISPDSTVLDVGANVGRYSVRMAAIAQRGSVIAFEPVADTRQILNYVLNRFRAHNVKVCPWALSDESREISMVAPTSSRVIGYNPGLAHFSADTPKVSHVSFVVETRRYDELGIEAQNVDFVKCDVEGVELKVFKGMNRMLQRDQPTILVEIESRHTKRFGYSPIDVQQYLEQMGYPMHIYDGNAIVPSHEVTENEKNYLFIAC